MSDDDNELPELIAVIIISWFIGRAAYLEGGIIILVTIFFGITGVAAGILCIPEIKKLRKSLKQRAETNKRRDEILKSWNPQYESPLFEKDLLDCCFQSLRLKDVKCICGERLDYDYKVGDLFETEETRYSDELKANVLDCCYQTALFSDAYCICGRALNYPS